MPAVDGYLVDLPSSGWGLGSAAVNGYLVDFEPETAPERQALPIYQIEEDIFGVDIDVLEALPGTFRLARGLKNLGNALARRLQTPRGFLHQAFGGNPDYGYDLVSRLNGSWGPAELAAVASQVEEQFRQDERVLEAEVEVRYSLARAELEVSSRIQTEAGPFRLVLQVGQVGVDVLIAEMAEGGGGQG